MKCLQQGLIVVILESWFGVHLLEASVSETKLISHHCAPF